MAEPLSHGGRPEPRRWVIKHVIPERYPSATYGAGGVCKSFLALHKGITVADPNRDYWFGYECATGPVIYADFELDREEQATRAFDVAAGMGLAAPPEDLLYMPCVGYTTAEAFAAIYETCREVGAKLVIVDSLGMAMLGDMEGSSDVIGFYRDNINPFRDLDAGMLLVDHQAKIIKGERYADKEEFGSVFKRNQNRSVFQINGEWNDTSEFNATFTHKKSNFGPKLDPIYLNVTFDHERIDIAREDNPIIEASTQDRIVASLREHGPATNSELAERLGMQLKDVKNRTGELKREARIEETGEKRNREKVLRESPGESPKLNPRDSGTLGLSGRATLTPDEDDLERG